MSDLISREALRKAFHERIWHFDKSSWDEANALIDNAQTVEERPQGEWGKWIVSEIRCPECLEYYDPECYSKEELNKCPNCGAKMQKGGAE